LSKRFGLTDSEIKLMEITGNLHDIGKLVIPDSILEKPDNLSTEERNIMKSHTYYTYHIINTIEGLRNIAEWGAYHHERLDGSGYPFHCREDELSTNARIIMVADIFTALAEDRPYRKAMSQDGITKILKGFSARQQLDSSIINLLLDNYDEIHSYTDEKQKIAQEYYERKIYNNQLNKE
jgi:HD-GYP domain-containing protein (c-di-GMP phosphodiesterase class II)